MKKSDSRKSRSAEGRPIFLNNLTIDKLINMKVVILFDNKCISFDSNHENNSSKLIDVINWQPNRPAPFWETLD